MMCPYNWSNCDNPICYQCSVYRDAIDVLWLAGREIKALTGGSTPLTTGGELRLIMSDWKFDPSRPPREHPDGTTD